MVDREIERRVTYNILKLTFREGLKKSMVIPIHTDTKQLKMHFKQSFFSVRKHTNKL